ncbi:MAG: hypothetical protein DCF18_12585 [Cyanobium sp.]|uniref:OsmC family protein n=1 Tax=Synechococcus sp. CS-1333 TaxID=2848638 RepID=UPI000DBC3176|nr:OsmC family protein [Synechococcus sp. CS-1333]MCT0210140.1 OsmC family protein [Synechococcus sp. CS-1333]PZV21191.1 MAG: hypothetical protein DCF18_12585 [Cyanobium sp.]
MNERTFQFRLRSSHPAPDRATHDLVVEFLSDSGAWEPQQLSFTMPGFRIYLISLLLCQHFYLVANAREKAIPLLQVEADFVVTTSSDWIVARVEGDFRIQLDAAFEQERGLADAEAIAYIQERMKLCPVSRNLPDGVCKRIVLTSLS